mgnify:CR=1 FL=1
MKKILNLILVIILIAAIILFGLVIYAKFIYKHIDDDMVGKAVFAHALLNNLTEEDIIVPKYIKDAVLWACGGY